MTNPGLKCTWRKHFITVEAGNENETKLAEPCPAPLTFCLWAQRGLERQPRPGHRKQIQDALVALRGGPGLCQAWLAWQASSPHWVLLLSMVPQPFLQRLSRSVTSCSSLHLYFRTQVQSAARILQTAGESEGQGQGGGLREPWILFSLWVSRLHQH